MKNERSIILIDGANFYYKLKDLKLHNLLNFNFQAFAKFLARDSKVINSTYYVGEVRTDGREHTQKLYNNQQKLVANLKKNSFRYSFGYLLKYKDGIFHEKGVDVNIAVDMLVATYEDQCDRIILVSSDTDLIPAVKRAKIKGKVVEYIGFSHKSSIALYAKCSETRLLTKEDLLKFVNMSEIEKTL